MRTVEEQGIVGKAVFVAGVLVAASGLISPPVALLA